MIALLIAGIVSFAVVLIVAYLLGSGSPRRAQTVSPVVVPVIPIPPMSEDDSKQMIDAIRNSEFKMYRFLGENR